jgi:putative membrane protein
MSIISHDLATRVTPGGNVWHRVIVSAAFMTLWDFALDPAMNRAFPFWVYPEGGFFYGMPASNWLGWLGVSAVIAYGYEVIGGGLPRLSRWAPWVYALNCLFPLGLSAIYGLHLAVVVGFVAMLIPLLSVAGHAAIRPDLHPERFGAALPRPGAGARYDSDGGTAEVVPAPPTAVS